MRLETSGTLLTTMLAIMAFLPGCSNEALVEEAVHDARREWDRMLRRRIRDASEQSRRLAEREFKRSAIQAGYADWVSDEEGDPKFAWKVTAPEEVAADRRLINYFEQGELYYYEPLLKTGRLAPGCGYLGDLLKHRETGRLGIIVSEFRAKTGTRSPAYEVLYAGSDYTTIVRADEVGLWTIVGRFSNLKSRSVEAADGR